jgi:hypothetical protein
LSAPFSNRLRAAASIATAILCVHSRAAASQSPAEVQVRAVVDSFFAAAAAEKWDAAAGRLDMAAFDKILEQARGNARVNGPTHFLTVEELMARDSMPRAVAEWQVARFAKFPHDPYVFLTHEFARVSMPREFLALTPDEAAARWLEARDFRYRTGLAWKRACAGDMPPGWAVPERHTILGVAIGNDSTAYVIQTAAAVVNGYDMLSSNEAPSMMVLARRGSRWTINPNFTASGGSATIGPPCAK